MKIIIISVLTFVLSVSFGNFAGGEMAKKGEGIYKSGMSWTFNALPMEKERLHMTFEVTGVVLEAPVDSPLHNVTLYALGALHAVKGSYEERGFVCWTRPDGDKIFATYEATGKLGGIERKITFTFVGGTGKCVGIEGGGELTGVSGLRHATKEVRQSASVGRFHWKIP